MGGACVARSVSILRAKRLIRGLTCKEAALEIGCAESVVSLWERGLRRPSFANLRRYAEVLQVSTDELLAMIDDVIADRQSAAGE